VRDGTELRFASTQPMPVGRLRERSRMAGRAARQIAGRGAAVRRVALAAELDAPVSRVCVSAAVARRCGSASAQRAASAGHVRVRYDHSAFPRCVFPAVACSAPPPPAQLVQVAGLCLSRRHARTHNALPDIRSQWFLFSRGQVNANAQGHATTCPFCGRRTTVGSDLRSYDGMHKHRPLRYL
jgi:hypothetical protein